MKKKEDYLETIKDEYISDTEKFKAAQKLEREHIIVNKRTVKVGFIIGIIIGALVCSGIGINLIIKNTKEKNAVEEARLDELGILFITEIDYIYLSTDECTVELDMLAWYARCNIYHIFIINTDRHQTVFNQTVDITVDTASIIHGIYLFLLDNCSYFEHIQITAFYNTYKNTTSEIFTLM